MAEGNKNYDCFFSDVGLDVHEIVQRMLFMAKNDALTTDPEGGTLAINIGFGSQTFSRLKNPKSTIRQNLLKQS